MGFEGKFEKISFKNKKNKLSSLTEQGDIMKCSISVKSLGVLMTFVGEHNCHSLQELISLSLDIQVDNHL